MPIEFVSLADIVIEFACVFELLKLRNHKVTTSRKPFLSDFLWPLRQAKTGSRRGQADLFDLLSRRPSLSALLNFSTTLCRKFKGVLSCNPQCDLGALSIRQRP